METVPQVVEQLQHLAHISIEYSSTLYSYNSVTDILGKFKEYIMKEIKNRQQEMKIFSTQQGIGLRKIMFQHYQRVLKVVKFYLNTQIQYEHELFEQVTKSIYEKHKVMENSLNFVSFLSFQISPIMKQIQNKAQVLDKELIQIKEKIERLKEKKINHQNQSFNLKSFLKREKNQAKSEIFQAQEKALEKYVGLTPMNSHSFSLFSPRKFDFLETQAQFIQVESFLQLKLQQVQEFIKLQKQLTERTIKKIYEIFDQTMGKGLERLENFILNCISVKKLETFIQIPELPLKNQSKKSSESSSSIDLSCHQSLNELMGQDIDFEKFRFVRKRLYESSRSKQDDLSESNKSKSSSQSEQFGISPTFKFTCPLIIQSVDQISQFITPIYEISKNQELNKLKTSQSQQYFLYDSFCKENVNTINI